MAKKIKVIEEDINHWKVNVLQELTKERELAEKEAAKEIGVIKAFLLKLWNKIKAIF